MQNLGHANNMYLDRFNQTANTQGNRFTEDAARGGLRINQAAAQRYGRTNENFSERGIFNSGLRQQQLGRDALGFQNQREDLARGIGRGREDLTTQITQGRQDQGVDYASQLGGLNQQLSQAGADKQKGLYDLLLESAAQLNSDGNLPYYAKGVY